MNKDKKMKQVKLKNTIGMHMHHMHHSIESEG
jgi:hypothetical protein